MSKYYLFIFILLLFFESCENDVVVESTFQHTEYIVVQGILINDSLFSGVSFKKTLPINEVYSNEKAEIKDASAYLKINGAQVIPLHYSSNGIYKSFYDLTIESGNTYELFAKVEGKSVYSKTFVPEKPVVKSAVYQNNFFITADIIPKQNEAYGAAWIIGNNSNIKSDDFYTIENENTDNPTLAIRTKDIPEEYRTSFYISSTYIKVYSFDSAFETYFKTKGNNKPIDNSLIQSGGAVAWNVYGENVIGLFIGLAEGDLVKPN